MTDPARPPRSAGALLLGTALLLTACSGPALAPSAPAPSAPLPASPTAGPAAAAPAVEILGRASDLAAPDTGPAARDADPLLQAPPAETATEATTEMAAIPATVTAGEPEFVAYIVEAVRDHPVVAAARSARGVADAIVEEAEAARLPELTVSLSGRGIMSNRTAIAGGDTGQAGPVRQDFRTDATLGVSQLLYDFGATQAEIEAAQRRGDVSQEELRLAIGELVLQAVASHLEVLQWRKKRALALDNVDYHARLLDQVEDRVLSGAEPQSTLLLARSRLSDARATAIEADGALDQAKAAYRQVFGQSPDEAPLIDPIPEPPGLPTDIEAALEEAQRGNIALRARRSAVEAARQSHAAAQATRLPRLRLEAQATQYDVLRQGTGLYDVTGGLVIGHELLGFSERARERQALERRRQAEAGERSALLETQRLVVALFTELMADANRREALAVSVEANLDRLAAYDEQFRIGRRSLIELLDVRSDLFRARMQLVDQETALALARYQLLDATGRLVGHFGLEP